METIQTTQQLNTFVSADTQSEKKGLIDKGIYKVLQYKQDFPDDSTDYAQIISPNNEQVWICSRYKETEYAKPRTQDKTLAYNFDNDDMAIDESELIDLLPSFYDYEYDLHDTAYPYQLRGCNLPLRPPAKNNCCTFVEALLVKAWENSFGNFSWDNQKHGKMMILSADDYFSPITCLVEQKMAVNIDDVNKAPEPWTALQVWRQQWGGGHTFIILDYHAETDRVLTLESNSYFNLNGVGYRMIGNIAKNPHPTQHWWKDDSLWTWEKMKANYPNRKMGKLKVKNVNWVNNS